MADLGIFGDIAGAIGNFNNGMGNSLVGILAVLQLPLLVVFVVVSYVLFKFLFAGKWVLVFPWDWKFNITEVIPYADNHIIIRKDKGALVFEAGILRFKMQKNNTVMQKPDAADVYSNNETIIVSLSTTKKLNAKRIIDYENHKISFDVESPKVAQLYWVDTVQANDPEIFYKRVNQMHLLWLIWFFSGLMLACSNFLVIYPIFVKAFFMGG